MHDKTAGKPKLTLVPSRPKLIPWTVKGVDLPERKAMNDAAKRAQMTLGQWLVETANLRLADERVQRVPEARVIEHEPAAAETVSGMPQEARAPGAPSLAEIAAVLQALPALSEARGCGTVARVARRVVVHLLEAHAPMPPPSSAKRPSPVRRVSAVLEAGVSPEGQQS